MKKLLIQCEVPEEWDDTIHALRIDAIDTIEGDLAFDTLPYKIIEPIKAKALRKRGTDIFYSLEVPTWKETQYPQVWPSHLNIEFYAISNLPPDAELVNIKIIIEP